MVNCARTARSPAETWSAPRVEARFDDDGGLEHAIFPEGLDARRGDTRLSGLRAHLADDVLVANKTDNTLQYFADGKGEPVWSLPTGKGPHEVAVSPDRKRAVVTNYGHQQAGNSLSFYDLSKAQVTSVVDLGEHSRPHGIVWMDDGRLVVTTEGSRSLIVVDSSNGKILSAVKTDQDVSHMVAVSAATDRAFVSNIGSGSVTVIDLKEGKKNGI